MRLALYQPDIAQNTGTILRLAACFGVPVDVIGPTGFDMSDRALKRAALDYLTHVNLTRHTSFDAFVGPRQAVQKAVSSCCPRRQRRLTATSPLQAMTPFCSAGKAPECPKRFTSA